MAISFPSSPNDGDLYSAVGRTWQYDATASAWKSISESNVTLSGLGLPNHETINVDSNGNTILSGNFTPDTNITYDLGSTTNRWRDLYLSGNSIELGDRTITSDNIPDVNLAIAPEVLEIQVSAPQAGQDTQWLWTWEQSTLPYARRTITNSPEVSVPLYKQGTYIVNNYAAYDLFDQMTQTHSLYLKWIDGAGTDNLVSWATSTGPVSDSHPDINSGNTTDVQRINISVPSTITLPTLTAPNVSYTVVNNGAGAYTFSGAAKGDNPNLGPFYRGGTYTINITATGHPFYFTTDNGTNFASGTYFGEYTSGVTGSRTDSGTITFTVPNDAPDTLYYQCGNHSVMRGAITIRDLAIEVNNNGNYVLYFQHTQEGHKTPVEIRPIPSLVNQMCLVYDASSGKFVPQDLATYVENTPSFENKIREVAGTAELVVEDGSAVIAKVNVYDDSTYLPLVGNNPGDQAFATDTDILYIWDGSAWQQAGASNSDDLTEGTTNLFFTDARVDARLASGSIGDLVVGGNLTVNGTTTTINSTTLTVDDKNIVLASGAADAAAANGAGITIDGANATIAYDGTNDKWDFNKDINITGNLRLSGSIIDTDESEQITFDINDIIVNGKHLQAGFGLWIRNVNGSRQAGIDGNANLLQTYTGGQIRTTVDSNGRLGIGTENPSTPLHVVGKGYFYVGQESGLVVSKDEDTSSDWYTNDQAAIRITNRNANGAAILKLENQVGRIVYGNGADGDSLIFSSRQTQTATTEQIIFDNEGNIGLGSAPETTIDINAGERSVLGYRHRVQSASSGSSAYTSYQSVFDRNNNTSVHSGNHIAYSALFSTGGTTAATNSGDYYGLKVNRSLGSNGLHSGDFYGVHINTATYGRSSGTNYGVYIADVGTDNSSGPKYGIYSVSPDVQSNHAGRVVIGSSSVGSQMLTVQGVEADIWMTNTSGGTGTIRLLASTGANKRIFRVYDNEGNGDQFTVDPVNQKVGIGIGSSSTLYTKLNVNGGILSQSANGFVWAQSSGNSNATGGSLRMGKTNDNFSQSDTGWVGFRVYHDADDDIQGIKIVTKNNASNSASNSETIDITPSGDILPETDASQDLGSPTQRWDNVYTTDLHLSNQNKPGGNDVDGTTGNWTLQEGAETIYMINNITGKKYEIMLKEVD